MSKDQDARSEIIDAFKTLIARIGEIFGIFDLSFFVAGVVCLGALVFGAHVFRAAWLSSIELGKWTAAPILAAVLASYVLGIVCFAAGRAARGLVKDTDRLHDLLRDQLTFSELDADYQNLLPKRGDQDAASRYGLLYTRLWAEVRQTPELAPSFNLCTRYWVMAAMCDGLSSAFGVWTVILTLWEAGAGPAPRPSPQLFSVLLIGLVGASVLCFLEARRYSKYQVYELVATLAHQRAQQQP